MAVGVEILSPEALGGGQFFLEKTYNNKAPNMKNALVDLAFTKFVKRKAKDEEKEIIKYTQLVLQFCQISPVCHEQVKSLLKAKENRKSRNVPWKTGSRGISTAMKRPRTAVGCRLH